MSKMRRLLLVCVLLSTGSGCGRPAFLTARNGEFPMYEHGPLPDQVTSFIKLYEQNCQACHGALVNSEDGQALTAEEKQSDGRFGPAPPLNDPLFLAIVSDDQLRQVISDGRPGTLMPAFAVKGVGIEQNGVRGGPLTADQVNILIKGVRGRWGKKVEGPLPEYKPAKPLSGNVESGKKLFKIMCADCHQGKRSVDDPAFLALLSDQVLRRIIITGRPDLKYEGNTMPDFRTGTRRGLDFKPLTEQDIADLTALLISWRTPADER